MIVNFQPQELLKISGNDRIKLLQGQLTCDVMKTPCMGAQCTKEGKVISLFILFADKEAHYLLLPAPMLNLAKKALAKYAVFYKVTLETVSDEMGAIGYDDTHLFKKAVDMSLCTYIYPNKQRYISFGTRSQLEKLNIDFNINERLAWQKAQIKEDIPTVYETTSKVFLPHELNLPILQAVDFEKGCYTGQEIIARMHYRGKLKNHLYHGSAKRALLPGERIFLNDQEKGMIVDGASTPPYEFLAVLNKEEAKQSNLHLADKTFISITTQKE